MRNPYGVLVDEFVGTQVSRNGITYEIVAVRPPLWSDSEPYFLARSSKEQIRIPFTEHCHYATSSGRKPESEPMAGPPVLMPDGPGMSTRGSWQPCDGPGEYFEEDIPTDGPDSAI